MSSTMTGFLAFSGHSTHQDTKPRLSATDPAAALPWGLRDFATLSSAAPHKGRLIYAIYFGHFFFFFFFLRAPRNIFKLSIFKHYLLAVKKIDPLRARGWRRRRRGLKRGLKIAQPLDSCSYWKQSPLLTPLRLSTSALQLDLLRSSLLGTDATGSRPEQSPS